MASLGGGGREYVLKIVADVKDAIKGVDDVATKTSGMKDKMLGVGKAVATGLAVGAVIDFGRQSLNAAADADDAMDAVVSAFGGASKTITDFSKNTDEKMGLSAQDYQTMAAKTGRILTGFGIDNEKAAEQTNTLATRAADMAAIVGGSTEDAMGAIDKAMQGQMKGLKAYGISITNAEVEARAMADGYVDASGKVTEAGKAIATQELILEKTNKYQGEFAKNSKDLGSQQDIMRAKFENLQSQLGTALIPVMQQVFDIMKPLIDFIAQNTHWLVPLAAGITAVVGAQWALNIAMAANPIGLVIAAVIALAAAFLYLYSNVQWFHDFVNEHWIILVAAMLGPYPALIAAIYSYWDEIIGAFKWLLGQIQSILSSVWDTVTHPFIVAAEAVAGFFQDLPGRIQGYLSNLANIIKAPFVTGFQWVVDAAHTISDFFYSLPGKVAGWLSNISSTVSQPFRTGFQWILDALHAVSEYFYNFPGKVAGWFSSVANTIASPFTSAFNAIKNAWNNTVGKLSFTIPSWVPGIGGKGWTAPRLAAGGIVTRPTIAMIGEAGPEAVIPLSGGNSLGLGNVIINVYALTANAEVGRQVYNALREYERVSGSSVAHRAG